MSQSQVSHSTALNFQPTPGTKHSELIIPHTVCDSSFNTHRLCSASFVVADTSHRHRLDPRWLSYDRFGGGRCGSTEWCCYGVAMCLCWWPTRVCGLITSPCEDICLNTTAASDGSLSSMNPGSRPVWGARGAPSSWGDGGEGKEKQPVCCIFLGTWDNTREN